MEKEKDVPKLTYTQIEVLESEGKRYTGNHQEKWVDSKSVCTSCTYAHIMRRGSQNKRMIHCDNLGKFVPEDIQECNQFRKFTDLSISQMGEMATLLGIPEKKVGFYGDKE